MTAANRSYVQNIRDGMTLSGVDVNLMEYTAGYEEYFCGEAWMRLKLNKKSKKNDERVCALIDEYFEGGLDFDIYDIDSNDVEKNDFIAVYVFYLLDELAKIVVEKGDGWAAVGLINKLWHCMLIIDPQLKSALSIAKKAATARHSENRAMKQQAYEWYIAFGCKLKNDDAAIQITKLVPIALRTAQDWVSDFRKKIRSAGTA